MKTSRNPSPVDPFRRKPRLTLLALVVALVAACGTGQAAQSHKRSTAANSTTKATQTLNVTVVGDSIPYGQGDCEGCAAFVDLYSAALQTRLGKPVTATNLSTHDNLTTSRLLERIKHDRAFRSGVAAADILIVSIGRNDTPWASDTDTCDGASESTNWKKYADKCVTQEADGVAAALTAILAEAKALRGGKPTVAIVINIYNDWIGDETAPSGVTTLRPPRAPSSPPERQDTR